MNYEEKYNEILEWARKYKARLNGVPIEEVLPELTESEDERIRKWIVKFVTEQYPECWKDKKNKMLAYLEKQKEQKPVKSISQPTVQGKGVYKICPRCKERMVRDDSMVYTSMPPQYRYECPKCGESECDTVMYDNPEMEEQKPLKVGENAYFDPNTEMWFIKKKQKPAEWNDFEIRLMDCMLAAQQYRQGSIDLDIVKPWAEELSELIEQPKKKWDEFDKDCLKRAIWYVENPAPSVVKDTNLVLWLQSLHERFNLQPRQEWSVEDKMAIDRACVALRAYANGDLPEFLPSELIGYADRLQSLRPSWKPTEKDLMMLEHIIGQYEIGNKNSKTMGYLPRVEELNFLKKILDVWKN